MGGRRVAHTRGKVLGGSSSINGMIFQRGNPLDYERWAADPGMERWDYAHCLPYFKRMEDCRAGADDYRGKGGPLVLERGEATNPLFGAFFEAVQQAGYQLTDDVNGFRQEGFARFDQNLHRGRRLSAARAYLHPVSSRRNLDVVTRANVMGVRFAGRRATGVEYRTWRGEQRSVTAGEVILCGGAFNSPQLLQVSGVGDADHLRNVGVPVVHHLPGVGANLQDHLEVYVQHAATQPVSLNPLLAWRRRPWIGLQWILRRGPGTTNHFEAGGFVRSNDDVAYPNLMFHFLPIAVRYDGSRPPAPHGYQVHVGPMYSDVRGSVRITSPDARVKPALRFNYLSTPTTAASGSRRSTSPATSSASRRSPRSTAARCRPVPASPPTRRSSTGWPTTPRPPCTRRARARWAPASSRWSIRTRCASTASTGCASSTPR